jgi:hypothetical protein
MNHLLRIFSGLLGLLTISGCIREISFEAPEADSSELVVSGSFTNLSGPHILRLLHPGDFETRDFSAVVGAEVRLVDETEGHSYPFAERFVPAHRYQLDSVSGIPGHIYHLEIRLNTGQEYRSSSDRMPEPIPADSLLLDDRWVLLPNSEGRLVQTPEAFLRIYSHLPAQIPADVCLRWDSDCTFIFQELQLPGPFAPAARQCFISSSSSQQLVELLDMANYQGGANVSAEVGRLRVNYFFENRVALIGRQRTITREAFNYWKKVKSVVEPQGTIFDPPPARIAGNVRQTNDPNVRALGLFEIAAVDTLIRFANRGNLSFELRNYVVPYCNGAQSSIKNECFNCLVFPNSTLLKPEWWR